ncbi:MAG: hypothetical protein R3362_11450 [Rhodothermales bacterium]|nr:hypothetical protein [Rhodothermales bacterium]
MAEEVAVIVVVAIICGTLVSLVKAGLAARQASKPTANAAPGLRESELRMLIRDAAAEANAPLDERLERLEHQMERLARRALPPAAGTPLQTDLETPLDVPVPRRSDAP